MLWVFSYCWYFVDFNRHTFIIMYSEKRWNDILVPHSHRHNTLLFIICLFCERARCAWCCACIHFNGVFCVCLYSKLNRNLDIQSLLPLVIVAVVRNVPITYCFVFFRCEWANFIRIGVYTLCILCKVAFLPCFSIAGDGGIECNVMWASNKLEIKKNFSRHLWMLRSHLFAMRCLCLACS